METLAAHGTRRGMHHWFIPLSALTLVFSWIIQSQLLSYNFFLTQSIGDVIRGGHKYRAGVYVYVSMGCHWQKR